MKKNDVSYFIIIKIIKCIAGACVYYYILYTEWYFKVQRFL